MKIAIVCDWLVTIGGAEKVLEELLHCFPEADLFAVVDFIAPKQRDFLQGKSVKTTFIQQLPFAKTKYRHYLPLMPLAIEQLDLSGYDVILSSSHAVAKGVITGPDQIHISYIHSPMRYAWDLQHDYLREAGLDKKWTGYLARYFLHKLRLWDARSANNVDYMIANSHFIARRIMKTYRREASVIYPPVATERFTACTRKDNFYLACSRFVPYKKIDLIVESFQQLPDKKLIVIGDGPEMAKVKKKAGNNVQLLGYQTDHILIDHMQRAKALIFVAEEDFGIIPVEAQACGTPVIAYSKGGALETIRGLDKPNPTGIFFNEQNTTAICKAIAEFETVLPMMSSQYCIENAKRFSAARFREEMISFVQRVTAQPSNTFYKQPITI